jgi:hypothetical protein
MELVDDGLIIGAFLAAEHIEIAAAQRAAADERRVDAFGQQAFIESMRLWRNSMLPMPVM